MVGAMLTVPPNLLADSPQVIFDRSISILDNLGNQPMEKVIYAVKQLSPKWLERSRFYSQYPEDCNRVIFRSLRHISEHYDIMKEGYEATRAARQVRLGDAQCILCEAAKLYEVTGRILMKEANCFMERDNIPKEWYMEAEG